MHRRCICTGSSICGGITGGMHVGERLCARRTRESCSWACGPAFEEQSTPRLKTGCMSVRRKRQMSRHQCHDGVAKSRDDDGRCPTHIMPATPKQSKIITRPPSALSAPSMNSYRQNRHPRFASPLRPNTTDHHQPPTQTASPPSHVPSAQQPSQERPPRLTISQAQPLFDICLQHSCIKHDSHAHRTRSRA